RAWTVAARRVVRPPLVPADVDGAAVGDGRVQRVAAGVVHPLWAEPAGPGRGEGGGHVAEPGEREGTAPVEGVVAGGGDVDGGLVGRPGRALDVEGVAVGAVLAELAGVPVADVPVVSTQVEHEDLLP